jgi:hypothetical protein
MKSKLQIQTLAASLILIASLATASAQPAPHRAPPVNPAAAQPFPAALIDPNTGLPLPPAAPQWIDSNWNDPDLVLTNVVYENLPLSEVARDLREHFKDHFDILPTPGTFGRDWGSDTIQLQLKNVKASDVFNAMNLIFENNRTPLRWELKVTGYNRQVALLRVLPEAAPEPPPQVRPPETHRMVYFVGNLIGDEKSGGMPMDHIIKTILDIWPADLGKPEEVIQFHKEAQLLVVNGTPDQLEFVHQALTALEQKVEMARPKSAEEKAIAEQVKMQKNLKNIGDNSK